MVSEFAEKVYNTLKTKVPKGKVTTYKALAQTMGKKSYRAVGQVLNKNPFMPEVPCHRVISNDGTIGGFAHGEKAKIEMLEHEGIKFDKKGKIDESQILRSL